MRLEFNVSQVCRTESKTEMKMEYRSHYQTACELYASSPKICVPVPFGRIELAVPAALVEASELERIIRGEYYAATIGGMFFITKQTPEKYRHFAALHELVEHAANRGFDATGLKHHYQALAIELAYVQETLNSEDRATYLQWRKKIERSKFFKYKEYLRWKTGLGETPTFFQIKESGLIDRIAGRIMEIFEDMSQYLTYNRKPLFET